MEDAKKIRSKRYGQKNKKTTEKAEPKDKEK